MTYGACFVDTSAWFALLIANNQHHADVSTAYRQVYGAGASFVTTSLVLGELYTLLVTRTQNVTDYWSFWEKVHASTRIRVYHPTPQQMDAAFDLLRHRSDKTYSFVDATSFVVMRSEGLSAALTLDRHFAQEGFHVVPAPVAYVQEATESYRA